MSLGADARGAARELLFLLFLVCPSCSSERAFEVVGGSSVMKPLQWLGWRDLGRGHRAGSELSLS